ncbi:MAG: hemerythrin domain-containing protein [Rikenellaceae bacterium]|nr:hemerythrin domain-containing protein [Rikenellaceae bacterium]
MKYKTLPSRDGDSPNEPMRLPFDGSGEMKLADLILEDHRLLPVLERTGIGLGFGEKRVSEACAQSGIPVELFMLICSVHSREGYVPDSACLKSTDISGIVEYLHQSHEYFRFRQIPSMSAKLTVIEQGCDPLHGKMLRRFFEGYRTELENHFEYEETEVFPYMKGLLSGKKAKGYSIPRFEENHTNIEEKLNDLKNILLKYLPADCCPEVRSEMLYDIFRLEEDLKRHTTIEDLVLIPLVSQLGKTVGQ